MFHTPPPSRPASAAEMATSFSSIFVIFLWQDESLPILVEVGCMVIGEGSLNDSK
jgi:hypothetical protein